MSSKLSALHNAAKNYNPAQPRDADGKWTKVKGFAQTAVEKGIIAGAGAAGHHLGGEAGAVAAMVGARAAIVIGKKAFANAAQKQKSHDADDLADKIEEAAMGDVFGKFVAKSAKELIGGALEDAIGIPGAGTVAGMAASAAITPQLVKAARRLKGKMQTQTTAQPRYAV